jgi:outer membrane protein assembly factor BamB
VSRRLLSIVALVAGGVGLFSVAAQADWTTYHGDAALTGVDHSSGTGLPVSLAWQVPGLTGTIWAEPLVYADLVIVVTETNDLYAFNEATGAQVWHANVGPPVPSSQLPCGDIMPTVGITSTPVIDPSTGTLYAVADLSSGTSASHTLVAYNAKTGARLFTRSVEPPSDPLNQLQRESLTLDQGRILIGFGGNDGDCAQYKGFLVSAPANNVGGNSIYAVPTSREGAIWSAGGAPAVDAAGSVYVATGNAANGPGQAFDHGDTLEKLTSLAAEVDYWAPLSWAQDSASDADLGSVSPELLPGNLIYQGGKNGNGYIVSSTNLGHIGGELFSAPVCDSFGADAYENGVLYVACTQGVRALNIDTATPSFSARWTGPSDANGPPIISGGLVWVTSTSHAKLYGLDPLTGTVKVTEQTPAMEHFITPAASDGRLFLATGSTLNAYTIATAIIPPPPNPNPIPTPNPNPTPRPTTCRAKVSFRLRVPAHERITRVAVYIGHRRIFRQRGAHLRRISLVHLSNGKVTLRVIESPRHGRRLTLTIRFRSCRRVSPAS